MHVLRKSRLGWREPHSHRRAGHVDVERAAHRRGRAPNRAIERPHARGNLGACRFREVVAPRYDVKAIELAGDRGPSCRIREYRGSNACVPERKVQPERVGRWTARRPDHIARSDLDEDALQLTDRARGSWSWSIGGAELVERLELVQNGRCDGQDMPQFTVNLRPPSQGERVVRYRPWIPRS